MHRRHRIDFCRKLLHDTDGPVYLVVDGHPTHRAKTVKEFVAATDGRLTLVILPAYSPQLNPDEGVWTNITHDRVGRTSATTARRVQSQRAGRPAPAQKLPATVRAFFADPDLAYIEGYSELHRQDR